jgi:hypothetical protein
MNETSGWRSFPKPSRNWFAANANWKNAYAPWNPGGRRPYLFLRSRSPS